MPTAICVRIAKAEGDAAPQAYIAPMPGWMA
jgi:hypothetical protein